MLISTLVERGCVHVKRASEVTLPQHCTQLSLTLGRMLRYTVNPYCRSFMEKNYSEMHLCRLRMTATDVDNEAGLVLRFEPVNVFACAADWVYIQLLSLPFSRLLLSRCIALLCSFAFIFVTSHKCRLMLLIMFYTPNAYDVRMTLTA